MPLSSLFLKFCETSSVKGLPRIVRSRSLFLKMLWLVTVLFGAILASFQLYKLISQFFTFSTVLSVKETEDIAPFPDITICNLNYPTSRNYGINVTMDTFLERLESYMREDPAASFELEGLHSRTGYFQNFEQKMFDKLDISKLSFVVDCSWNLAIPCPEGSVMHVFSAEYHSCFTFHVNMSQVHELEYVSWFSGVIFLNDFTEISFPLKHPDVYQSHAKGMKIIIHAPNTLPDDTSGVNIPPGYETSITLSPTKRNRLGPPHGDCSEQVTLIDGFDYKYSRSACESICYQEIFIHECQCLYVYEYTTREWRRKYPFCGQFDMNNVNVTRKRMECTGTIPFEELFEGGACNCKSPCSEYLYDFRIHQVPWPHESYHLAAYNNYVKNTPWEKHFRIYEDIQKVMAENKTKGFQMLRQNDLLRRNFLQLNVYFDNQGLKINSDEPSLTSERLLANLGGALNLWIGISFITLVEICELLYHLAAYICGERETSGDEKVKYSPAANECSDQTETEGL